MERIRDHKSPSGILQKILIVPGGSQLNMEFLVSSTAFVRQRYPGTGTRVQNKRRVGNKLCKTKNLPLKPAGISLVQKLSARLLSSSLKNAHLTQCSSPIQPACFFHDCSAELDPITTSYEWRHSWPSLPSSLTIPVSGTPPVPQPSPAPPPQAAPLLMAASPTGNATKSSMTMPEQNTKLCAAMNGFNSSLKAPICHCMPAPGTTKIGMKPVSQAKPKASKLNISLPVTSVYMSKELWSVTALVTVSQ
eukprot:1625124-Rhodomonas_salina.1